MTHQLEVHIPTSWTPAHLDDPHAAQVTSDAFTLCQLAVQKPAHPVPYLPTSTRNQTPKNQPKNQSTANTESATVSNPMPWVGPLPRNI